ncbi:hypothetical protein F3Y22_tig00110319pilonHSYRG00327 [Hibiscus syriacus]|uniref:Uncharacterized protein n=1 Tax=Hibiscus syriacus TaxID=106335 RepID=A0A6A3B663_HIBSY|nr:hypothetical protein F3Y22_tig00110319pilonHSYRG00327 [Hibiscus syriacus]
MASVERYKSLALLYFYGLSLELYPKVSSWIGSGEGGGVMSCGGSAASGGVISFESLSLFPSNSSSSEEISLVSDPLQTQKLSPENTSLSSESDEFPQDANEPFEIEFPLGTESNDKIPTPPPPSPEPPSPTKPVPCPPKHPWTLDDACKTRCSTMCMRHKVPILNNLCNEICGRRCRLYYSQLIYNCTVHCAYSMPKFVKCDKKKEAAYVGYCYHRCTKKF